MHQHRHIQRARHRLGGLQRAGIGGGDDAPDALMAQRLGRGLRLLMAERGQPWIDDTWIDPGDGEMQVEFALAMSEQDHGQEIAAGPLHGNPRPQREMTHR